MSSTLNPTFLANSLALCTAAFGLSQAVTPNRNAFRKLMDSTKKVVDFQLKFLHEEAKNLQEDCGDIKSRLLAQKRSTESEYREFKRRCNPETDGVTQFCSEFVTGMTRLTSVFCKAHVLVCIATVEMAERNTGKAKKVLQQYNQVISSRKNSEASFQKAFERLSRYLGLLGEAASYLCMREIISSEEVKNTFAGYFDYFNQLNEEMASCLNESVRMDITEEHQHKYLDLCSKIAIDIEALITDFSSTLEEELVFLIKLDLTKGFLKSIQELDKGRLRPKDRLEWRIESRQQRTQLRLKNKSGNPLLLYLEEFSDIIDLIMDAAQKQLGQNPIPVERVLEIVQKCKDLLPGLPPLCQKLITEQRINTDAFVQTTRTNIDNSIAAIKKSPSQTEIKQLSSMLASLAEARRFKALAEGPLEAKFKDIMTILQDSLDKEGVSKLLPELAAFSSLLVEVGTKSISTLDTFNLETKTSLDEVGSKLFDVVTTLQVNGADRETGERFLSICDKICGIIRLCAATEPDHEDWTETEEDPLASFASSENLLSSARRDPATSPPSGDHDRDESGSSVHSEELEPENSAGNDNEAEAAEKKGASASEDNLHPAHWFYATPDPSAKASNSANDESQNIWKESWGGLVVTEDNGKMQIEAASLNQLLIRLTSTSPDSLAASDFYRTFMMTMQTFTEPELFVRKLVERYEVPPCPQQSDIEIKRYEMHLKTPVQMRVCNLLKKWLVERYDQDLANRPLLIEELFNFIDNRVAQDSEYLSNNLRRVLNLYITGEGFRYHQKLAQENAQLESTEVDALPRVTVESQLSLSHFDPREVAEQLTLYDAELFRAIRLYELAGQAWNKKNALRVAPNLMKLINQTNKLSTWVANAICKEPVLKKRRKIMVNMILLCQQLFVLRNFNSVMGVLGGLAAASVSRLKFTESGLPPKVKKVFEDIQQEMSSSNSFKIYRDKLRSSTAPTIPFFGVILSDLTFIEDGNQDNTAEGLIYWAKRTLLYGVLSEFLEHQRACLYDFSPFFSLRDAIHYSLNTLNTPLKDLYELSLLIEPRAGLPQEKPRSLLERLRGL